MLKFFSDRLRKEDEGFTLIELMVVVLIIAILIAIAIPTFLGARKRAQDRATQSSLRNTLTAAKTIFTDAETYANANTTELASTEPSLTFFASGSPSTKATEVSVGSGSSGSATGNVFMSAAKSASGVCFSLRDNTQGPGTAFYKSESGTCDANTVTTAGTPSGFTVGW